MAKRDYYKVLGVQKDVDKGTLRSAYRKLAIKFHPDKNPGDKAAEESFKEAAEAYEVLSDAEKRAKYDRLGHAGVEGVSSTVEEALERLRKVTEELERIDKETLYGRNHNIPSSNPERERIFKHLRREGGVAAEERTLDNLYQHVDLSGFSFDKPMDFSGSHWGFSNHIKIHGAPGARKAVNGLDMTDAGLDRFDLQHLDFKDCSLGVTAEGNKGRSLVSRFKAHDCTFTDCDLTGHMFVGEDNIWG